MAWQMQSWLYLMSLNQVLVLAAYVLAFALFESFAVLGFVLVLTLLFPTRFFKEKFVTQASILVAILTLGAILLQHHLDVTRNLQLNELILYPVFLLAGLVIFIILFSLLLDRVRTVTKVINAFVERLSVFSLFYVPLGLLGLAVVIIRNVI
jgi:hypothetical protein